MIRKLILLLLPLLLVNTVFAVDKPQIYTPYPIIFVSGIQTSNTPSSKHYPSNIWPNTRIFTELKKYFLLNPNTSKYIFTDEDISSLRLLKEVPNLEFFFYDAQQRSLGSNADLLKARIEEILESGGRYYKPDIYTYSETPKIILLCHSLGGLIARKMLVDNHDNIQDKVAAIIFIGTPQQGSPLAAAGYFLSKEILALKDDIANFDTLTKGAGYLRKRAFLNVKQREKSKITGNLKFMKWVETDSGLYVSTRDSTDNDQLEAALSDSPNWSSLLHGLPTNVTEKGVIKGTLINDSSANSYSHTFQAYSFNWFFGIGFGAKVVRAVPEDPLKPLKYDLSDSDLYTLGSNIGVGNAHAIAGNKDEWIRQGICFKAKSLMGWNNFNIDDYSCTNRLNPNHFWDNGDGISNLASQTAIVAKANTHVIAATHSTLNIPIINIPIAIGETDYAGNPPGTPGTPDIILKAIDDAPVIESIRFGERRYLELTNDYAIIKLKDYLLADIEVVEMTAGGSTPSNLLVQDFQDPTTHAYRPYLEFGKEFLKERDYTVQSPTPYGFSVDLKLHLMPGEFVVKINKVLAGDRKIYLKIRNAAQKTASCAVYFTYHGSAVISKSGGAEGGDWPDNLYQTWSQVKEAAYNNFVNADVQTWIGGDYVFLGRPDAIGGYTYAVSGAWLDDAGYTSWWATEAMIYKSWLNLYLDIGSRRIKSIKFTGNSYKWPLNNGPDFNILVYHETSNNWPPEVSLGHDGDELLFSLSTTSFSVNDANKVEVEIDQTKINLNGNNVWEFKPDFPEANHILDPAPVSSDYPFTQTDYEQGAGIYYPALFVTFDEDNP